MEWAAAQPAPRRFLLETHLVLRIFESLPPRDLVSCMRVNTAFYTFAVRALHRHVILHEVGPWPRFCDTPLELPPPNLYGEFGALSGRRGKDNMAASEIPTASETPTVARRSHVRFASMSFPRKAGSPSPRVASDSAPRTSNVSNVSIPAPVDPILHRSWLAKFVRELEIYPHTIAKCAAFPPMDNVEVVRIRLSMYKSRTGHVWTFHTDAAFAGGETPPRQRRPSLDVFPECRALANLRPTRVVVLGAPAIYAATPVTCLPYTLLAAVDTYTLALGPDPDLVTCARASDIPRCRARAIMADVHAAASARKVTIVFWTTGPGVPWTAGYRSKPSTEFRGSWVARLFLDLADMLLHTPLSRTVTFVNTGAIDLESANLFNGDAARVERRVEGFFRSEMTRFCIESLGLGHAGAMAQGNRFHFVSMEAYLSSGEWAGQLDADSVEKWWRGAA